MSFLIAVHVNEGIVLASDRRTTYTNTQTRGDTIIQRIGIHTTNSTDKTFPCPNGAGISTCGDASLLGKPITGFIQDMIRSRIGDDCPVSSIPQIIIDYFNELPLGTVDNSQIWIAAQRTIQRIWTAATKDEICLA